MRYYGTEKTDKREYSGAPRSAVCFSPNLQSPISNLSRRAFTLVELLVTVTIIGILAGLVFGALNRARQTAREAATKATITKLNKIIMERYESYMTRRAPVDLRGMTPKQAAEIRLIAVRQLMRMEMPERWSDIINPAEPSDPKEPDIDGGITIHSFTGPGVMARLWRPALSQLYAQRYLQLTPDLKGSPGYSPAECLYMTISMGSPEAMEQFNQSEIGDVDGDGYLEFVDGWGRPIMWLRCAPGFVSPIQPHDPTTNHDPFDTRNVDPNAYQLIPLIYSAGPDGRYGIDLEEYYQFVGDPFTTFGITPNSSGGPANPLQIGTPVAEDGGTLSDYLDNITNHTLEVR